MAAPGAIASDDDDVLNVSTVPPPVGKRVTGDRPTTTGAPAVLTAPADTAMNISAPGDTAPAVSLTTTHRGYTARVGALKNAKDGRVVQGSSGSATSETAPLLASTVNRAVPFA